MNEFIAFLTSEQMLHAAGIFAGTAFGALQASTWWSRYTGRKARWLAWAAEKAVAYVWHNYLREIADNAKVEGIPVPKIAEENAHATAANRIYAEAEARGIKNPTQSIPKDAIDAAIVTAVKRFKTGHTGPTTKGGF